MTIRFELAPAAVLRAAAWPIESLSPFGDPDLARQVGAGRSFEGAYRQTIDRERAALWERTAGDPRFMKGLAVASESLLARVLQHAGPTAPRDKRTRHLETSLYRYLSRASTCTTPHGLWAGVSIARFGEDDATTTSPGRVDFTPDLVPFAAAFAALGTRPLYRSASRVRLSPTLHARGDGTWRFLARTLGGAVDVREMRADASLGSLLERVGDAGTGTLDDLASRARVPREILERLVDAGALVGGLAFPTRFASIWEALEVAGDLLIGDDRVEWGRAASTLSELAGRLNQSFDTLSAGALAAELAKAPKRVEALLATLGVADAPRGSGMRCDLLSPFSVTLGHETRRELLRGLTAHEHDLLRSTRERRVALAALVAARPAALGDELPRLLRERAGEGECDAKGNPWGCLVARLGEEHVSVVGVDESPVRPFARFSALLTRGHDVERWVASQLARLEAEHGVIACDLALPFDANPNVLARASLAQGLFEPWGASGLDLRGAELASESGALVLRVPSIGRAIVFAASTAGTIPCDPMAGPLAVLGFAESVADVAAGATASGGGFVRPESTVLDGPQLQELTRRPRQERYAHWLRLAATFGWPGRAAVAIDGRRSVVVATSSPLAIEAAFEGARDARVVVVERIDVSARIRSSSGHHVADVTTPFARSPHVFSSLKP